MNVHDLVVVDLKTDKESPVWEGKEKMFCGESCAYQLLIGNQANLDQIPQEVLDQDGTKVLFGETAYAYFLANATGLDDKNPGETRIIGEMKRAWERHTLSNPEDAAPLRDIVETAFRDSKTIRNHILSNMRPHSTEIGVTARSMAGITSRDTVLLVAEKDGITESMLKILGSNAGRIILTDSDDKRLELHVRSATQMLRERKISAQISSVRFGNSHGMQDAFEQASHVMVLQPMGANTEVDSTLMGAWRDRVREDGKLFHLKGDPLNRGKTNAAWNEFRPHNFIDLEALQKQREEDGIFNSAIIDSARNASHNCANAIGSERQPIVKSLHLPPDQYRERFGVKDVVQKKIPEPLRVDHLNTEIRHDLIPYIPETANPDWAALRPEYPLDRFYIQLSPLQNQPLLTPERGDEKAILYLGQDLPKRATIVGKNSIYLEGNLTKASSATMAPGTIISAYTLEPGSMVGGGEIIIIGNGGLANKSRNITKPLDGDATLIVVPETQREGVFLLMSGMVKSSELSPDAPDLKLREDCSNLNEILTWLRDNNLLLSLQAGAKHRMQTDGVEGVAQGNGR